MLYNKAFFLVVAIILNVVTVAVILGILENKEKLKLSILKGKWRNAELTFFPSFCSSKAIICYVVTLSLISAIYFNHALPFQFVAFGFVFVVIFFHFSTKLTMDWRKYDPSRFAKKLFTTSLIIRIVYVVFIYFYYIEMTGIPHMFEAGDELLYQEMGSLWKKYGYEVFSEQMSLYIETADSGYCWWLAIEYLIMGTDPITARLVKCLIDSFSCVLIYSLAERNFGERTARMAALFYMLMPNTWFYCGITLKETEMAFLTILFVERGDLALHSPKNQDQGFVYSSFDSRSHVYF